MSDEIKENQTKKISIKKYHAVTLLFMLLVIFISSFGQIYKNIYIYYVDSITVIVYVVLGYFLTNAVCIYVKDDKWSIEALLLSFIFFFSVFASFYDGNMEWRHMETILDKITITLFMLVILSMTIFMPVIFFAVALLHNLIISKVLEHDGK